MESGHDLDVWGGQDTTPVLVPKSPQECIAAENGRCPVGCRECLNFANEMKLHHRDTESTENAV